MAFIGMRNGHEQCQVRIQDYLEKDDRAIGHDFSNIYTPDEQRAWAYFMDKTRSLANNDIDVAGKTITYKHYVISPDPRDNVDLETLRELTMSWVHEFFGDENREGKLGMYEVAVVYHDDNTYNIPHAHIIVNNTDLNTGYRLQISNQQNIELNRRLQDMSEERGLSYFRDGEREPQATSHRYYTKVERNLEKSNLFVWKSDLANNIDIAMRTAKSIDQFEANLELMHIDFRYKDDDYVYVHPSNPERWQCSGYRLGATYSKTGVQDFIQQSNIERRRRSEEVRRAAIDKVMDDFYENMELAAVVNRSVTVHDVADTLRIIDEYGIKSQADFARHARALRKSASTAGLDTSVGRKYIDLAEQVERAAKIAEESHFLIGFESDSTTGQASGSASAGGTKRGGRTQSSRTETTSSKKKTTARKTTQGKKTAAQKSTRARKNRSTQAKKGNKL